MLSQVWNTVLLHYYIQFIVKVYDEETGKTEIRTPTVCRGTMKTHGRVEARFWFGSHRMRATAARVCAFVWGNTGEYTDGKKVATFEEFAEFGFEASLKDYEAHHLPFRGGEPRRDHAVPGELVVADKDIHAMLHGRL